MKKMLLVCFVFVTAFVIQSCGPTEVTVGTQPVRPSYTRPISPGSGYVWLEGDWIYRGGRYQWREGHWRRGGSRLWIGGSWESRNNGWYWRRGRWQ